MSVTHRLMLAKSTSWQPQYISSRKSSSSFVTAADGVSLCAGVTFLYT